MKRRLVFLGPPGAGKGTQSSIISEKLSLPRLATGDLLREAISSRTELGMRAKEYMDSGNLVPDDIVNRMLSEKLAVLRDGFLIDGYPRTIEQAHFLEGVVNIERVLYFDAPEDVLVARIVNRRICPKCNAVYNLEEFAPRVDNLCDRDGSPLVHRVDDNDGVARARIKTFWQKTAPLVNFYFEKGMLAKISADRKLEEVTLEILEAIRNGE